MSSSTPEKLKFGVPREHWCMSSNTARAHAIFASVRSGSCQFASISHTRAPHDKGRPLVDEAVPDAARLLVLAGALDEHTSGEPTGECFDHRWIERHEFSRQCARESYKRLTSAAIVRMRGDARISRIGYFFARR
jgi:hypothetical protein